MIVAKNIVEIREAVKSYGSKKIGPISLSLASGESVGLLGPNGSGKTTCIRMMMGLVKPSSGQVTVMGGDPIRNHKGALAHVGYSPELPNLPTFMTAYSLLSFTASLLGIREPHGQVMDVLDRVGLTAYAHFKIGKMSKGMIQRLSVAQALIGEPKLLILDEPMIGVDPAGAAHFREMFREFTSRGGTILLSSHTMSEVESLCSRVVMLHRGKYVFGGSVDEALESYVKSRTLWVEASGLTGEILNEVSKLAGVFSLEKTANGFQASVTVSPDPRPLIADTLVRSGCKLYSMAYESNLLEKVYINALAEADRNG
ncbi:MAG: ABC transporter ATP-binding protein [Thermoprotei archaeon]